MVRSIESIDRTSLYRGDDEPRYSHSREMLLLDIHLLRSAAFTAARLVGPPRVELCCPQHPAKRRTLAFDGPSGLLCVRDALLLGHLVRRCWDDGCAVEPTLSLSLNETAAAMGYTTLGGIQRRLAAAALQRLADTTFAWREVVEDEVVELRWRILESLLIDPDGGSSGAVAARFSPLMVQLIAEGYLQALHRQICQALVTADQVAARLWMALEAERLGEDRFYYQLFRSPPEAERRRSDGLFLAEVLGLDGWASRRSAAARIEKALQVITSIDRGRYRFGLEHGRDVGMYTLTVQRFSRQLAEVRCG